MIVKRECVQGPGGDNRLLLTLKVAWMDINSVGIGDLGYVASERRLFRVVGVNKPAMEIELVSDFEGMAERCH